MMTPEVELTPVDNPAEADDVRLVERQVSGSSGGSEFSEGRWALQKHEASIGCLTRAARAIAGVLFLTLACSTVALYLAYSDGSDPSEGAVNGMEVARIAFGSCSAYDMEDQPVWEDAIIPSDPDAWLWVGDMAYLDNPTVDCAQLPGSPQCNCTSDWLHQQPHSCMAGEPDHALQRLEGQLSVPGYQRFLEHMCPAHLEKGLFPPPGTDPSVCPRAVLGTWDDHDYGWNNGNRRLPRKQDIKQIFLDGIGEAQDSPRRNRNRGIEWRHTFNAGTPREIDVFLLDERYNRDPLPCQVRRGWCEVLVLPVGGHPKRAWCEDFLHGGEEGKGTCCRKDEEFALGWCLEPHARDDPLWAAACDPTDPTYGTQPLVLVPAGEEEGGAGGQGGGNGNGTRRLARPTGREAVDSHRAFPFCDVLGGRQRAWLAASLAASSAPVKIVASGSVLLGSPLGPDECNEDPEGVSGVACPCSGDDMECYRSAHTQLLHTLSRAPGCALVITGDYHYSDIKVARPGGGTPYARTYRSDEGMQYGLYQLMASGLTAGTPQSTGRKLTCAGWRLDPAGLRTHPECAFVSGEPSFGVVEVDWSRREVRLQVRVSKGVVALEAALPMDQCNPMVVRPGADGGGGGVIKGV